MKPVKMWIARDEAYTEDEDLDRYLARHPEKKHEFGQLHLFYGRPELTYDGTRGIYIWTGGREIATLQSYMYPQVKCKKRYEITSVLQQEAIPDSYQ